MRNAPALILTLLLGSVTLAACTDDSAPVEDVLSEVTESSAAADPVGEVYVAQITTLEGDDGELYDVQRPDSLMFTEFTFASDLVWESWGGSSAVASGKVAGAWCHPGCAEEGYDAKVVLCDVVDDHYQRFGIFGDLPGDPPEDWHLGSPMYFSDISYSDEEWYGCDEPEPSGN
ncbi:MAG TPA: hypothetical protein VHG10_06475 [Glycomyces sp.]|nr:hypothetical protein [Glycomyces sp.]